MLDKTIVIAALARDCADALERNIPRIEELRKHFKNSHIVIIENDSKDDTKKILQEWSSVCENIHLIMKDFGTLTIPNKTKDNPNPSTSIHRIEKMAFYRNMYMNYIRTTFNSLDYLLVMDIDINDFSINGIIKSMTEAPSNWGGLFAFGIEYITIGKLKIKPLMYDMFAYIHNSMPYPFTPQYLFEQKRKIISRVRKECYSPCLSAFGGVGIYKWEIIKNMSYTVQYNQNPIIQVLCEHIPFNLEISKNHTNYICKDMLVEYGKCPTKVSIRMMMPEKLFQFFKKLWK